MEKPGTKPLRDKQDFVKSPAGIPKYTALVLVPELDEHLSALSTLFHQYLKHHWLVPIGEVGALAEAGHTQALAHMHLVAERIVLLGGVPACHPIDQVNFSYLEHEPEGVYGVGDMLKQDLKYERDLARRTELTAEYALELGDTGSEVVLVNIQRAAESRAEGLEGLLYANGEGVRYDT